MRSSFKWFCAVGLVALLISMNSLFADPTSPLFSSAFSAAEEEQFQILQDKLESGIVLSEAEKDQYVELDARLEDTRGRDGSLDNQGGPDGFQYVFRDNVPPDNVPFNWIELRGDPEATWIGGLTHFSSVDDGYSRQKLPIGFSFPFYGATYDCVRVATNGFLQFTTTATSLSNACLPASVVAGPMIACLWDDLHLVRGGQADTVVVGYRNFGDYFVIEFDGIGWYSTSCPNIHLKFEAILYQNGNIKLQYATVTRPATACQSSQSIGIQSNGAAGSAALTYVCNATGFQPFDSLAIEFARATGIPQPCTNLTATYTDPDVVLTWTDPTLDTQGNPVTIQSVEVWLGAAGSGQFLGMVNPGVQTFTHANAPTGNLTYSVRPFIDPYYGSPVSVPLTVGTPAYSNNFDVDNGQWVSTPETGGWGWGIPWGIANLQPHSTPNVWGTGFNGGTYPNNACWQLDLNLGMVITSDAATVEFWHWFYSSSTYDGCNFKISVDNGATWTILTPTEGGYNLASMGTGSCMTGQPAWAGTTPRAWQYCVIPIGEYSGQVPIFRFEFASNATTNTYPGFYFDDFTIWGLSGQQAGIPTACTNVTATNSIPNVVINWLDPTVDTQGNPLTVDSVQVWLGPVSTGTYLGSVIAGTQTFTHLNAPISWQTYTVRPKNDNFFGSPVSVTLLVGNPGYFNDFENENGGWVATPDAGGWTWGAPTEADAPTPHSGQNLWGTGLHGDYANNACWQLDLNAGLAVTSSEAYVEFWHSFYSSSTYDGANFKASLDNGATWTVLTPTEAAYNTASMGTGSCITGQPGWAGTTPRTWQHCVIPIGEFMGQVPVFRFEFGTNASTNTYPGFFFDDIIIWGAGEQAGIPQPCTNLAGNYTAPNLVLTWTDPVLDIHGNPVTIDTVEIWFGAAGTGTLLGRVDRGIQTFTHVNAPIGLQTYTVRPENDGFYGAPTSIELPVGSPGYFNNFETGIGGWIPQEENSWAWGAPANANAPVPHSGTYCIGTGLFADYSANACWQLDLDSGLVVTSPTATVEFWYHFYSQATYDGCNFKASTDGGGTWVTLTPNEGNYNLASLGTGSCMTGQPAWAGTTPRAWQYCVIPISQFLGQTPSFRFEFATNATTQTYPGFFFDDLTIWGAQSMPGVPRPCTNLTATYTAPNVVLTWTDPTLDTQGNPSAIDSVEIWLTAVTTGIRLGLVAAGTQTFTHVAAPVGIQTYVIRPYNAPYWGRPTRSASVTVGNPSYVNDFELDNGGWTPDPPTGGWSWGAPTNSVAPAPHSGLNMWGTGMAANYTNGVDYKLDFAPNQIVQSPTATVEFWFRFDSELNYDGCNFKASVDGGTTWTIMTPSLNPYNVASMNAANVFMGGQPGWGGHVQTEWQYTVIPIGQFVGQIPIFRLEFSSDPSVSNYMGFFFDDMIIWGLQPPSGVAGYVRTFSGNLPISNARVWATGMADTARTDSTGYYRLGLDPGTYSITYDHVHFCDTTIANIAVQDGQDTPRNVTLRAPVALVSRTSMSLLSFPGVQVLDTFSIRNHNGQCPLDFSITDTSGWLTIEPSSGSVNPNQSVTITVEADAPDSLGEYVSNLVIIYNAVGSPHTIRVDLSIVSAANDPLGLPTEFALHQNYPNPFNATTALRFDVPKESFVELVLFNIMGQEVARPVSRMMTPGRHHIIYDARDLPSGMYWIRMNAGDFTSIGKMLLIK